VKNRHPLRRLRFAALFAAGVALGVGCNAKEKYQPYSPHENLLSIAAEFQLLSGADAYRDPLGRDLTGQSIARSTLVRLANYEALHPGRLAPEVLFLRARALELIGDYASAKRSYDESAEFETELREEARRRSELVQRLQLAMALEGATENLPDLVSALARRATDLRLLAGTFEDDFYRGLALRESEAVSVRRGELMATHRYLLPDGEQQAIRALEQLVSDHRDSARGMEHALRLAHFHYTLAEEEVRLNPPEGSTFSVERFRRHYDRAVDLMYRVAQADGRDEKLVARHELDALLAFGEQIQRRAR